MERKIGEIFEYNGEWYQCVEEIGCNGCGFNTIKCDEINDIIGNCTMSLRHDDKSVVFKRLEKVGEPYPKFIFGRGNIKVQRYKLYRPTNTNICNGIWIYHWNENLVDIEIKQNKEDMEENNNAKHSNSEKIGKNLKEFNLEAAKSGKPVCTRDGRKARIICFDMNANSPIVALVDYNGQEAVVCCHNDGRKYHAETTYNDLMMLSERKEGWVNLYRDEESKRVYCGEFIFSEREKAEKYYKCNDTKVATVSIGWEE